MKTVIRPEPNSTPEAANWTCCSAASKVEMLLRTFAFGTVSEVLDPDEVRRAPRQRGQERTSV